MSVGVRPTTIRARAAAALAGALVLAAASAVPAGAAGQTTADVGTCQEWRVVAADGSLLPRVLNTGAFALERGAAYRLEVRVVVRSDLWNVPNGCTSVLTEVTPEPGSPHNWVSHGSHPRSIELTGTRPTTFSLRTDVGQPDIDHRPYLTIEPSGTGSTLPETYVYTASQRRIPFDYEAGTTLTAFGIKNLPAVPATLSPGVEFADEIVLPFTIKADAPTDLVNFRFGGPVGAVSFAAFEVVEAAPSDERSGGGGGETGSGAGSTPLLDGGAAPSVAPGAAVLQQADGTTVPLAMSSPAAGQLRYQTDGLRITLTGGAGTSASGGLVVAPGGEITCEVCVDLATGEVIEAWMFSQPRLVAAHRVGDDPCQRFTIPVGAPLDGGGPVTAGAHTLQLALPTATGMQAVNVGVSVGGPVPASVPAGDTPSVPVWLVAVWAAGLAGILLASWRRIVTG